MTNKLFAKRALLPALLAAAFGAIALSLALLITPAPAVAQTAPADVATVRFVGMLTRSVDEGDTIQLRAELQSGLNATRTINVRVQLTGGIGGTMGDVRTLTIESGQNGGVLLVTLPSNNVAGTAPDPVIATLLPPSPLGLYDVDNTANQVTITVMDDDRVSVGFRFTSYSFEEGSQATVEVELRGSPVIVPANPIEVTVTGIPVPDGPNIMVELSDTNRRGGVTFTAPNDDDARVSPAGGRLRIMMSSDYDIDPNRATTPVGYFDDDDPIAEVRFAGSAARSGDEGTDVTLRATLQSNQNATRTIEVQVDLTGGLTGRRTLMINSGQNGGEITITLPNDNIQGDTPVNRDVMATLVDDFFYDLVPGPAGLEVAITVADNDTLSVGFGSATSSKVEEGDQVTVRVEFKTTVNPPTNVNVPVTVEGLPDPNMPGQTISETVMLSSANRQVDFTFNAPDDEKAHLSPDNVVLRIASGNYGIASDSGQATVQITDDNDPLATVRFTSDLSQTHAEGAVITLRAALQGSLNATRAITVRVQLSPTDRRSLIIADGANSGTLQITLPNDNVAGMAPDPVVATLVDRPPTGTGQGVSASYDVDSMRDTVTITVTDNDVVSVGFSAADYTFREGSQVTVTVDLKGNVVPNNQITVMVQGGPPGGTTLRTVQLDATDTSVDVTFTAPNDRRHAPPPPVTLRIDSPSGFVVDPSFGMTTVSFTDDGDPAARVGFVSPPTRLTEREQVTLNLALMTGGPATRAVTVTVTDGDGFSEMVTIADGQTSASFTYTAPNDQHARIAPEDVTLRLTNPMNGGVASGSDSAKISFRDDGDALAVVGFVSPPTRLTEGDPVMLSVALEGNAVTTRAITVTVTDGHGLRQDVTIPNGQNSASFRYTPPDDQHARVAPAARTLQLALDPMDHMDGMLASASAAAPISFRDDNDPLAVVGFAPRSDQQILQGGVVKFVAQLQGGVPATRAVHLKLMFDDDRAPETVTIPSGQSMVEYVLRTTSSGPTPPPLRLTIEVPGGQAALNADVASATLVQIPPIVGAEVPSAGGLELGWGALAALLAFALTLLAAAALLLVPRHLRRRPR